MTSMFQRKRQLVLTIFMWCHFEVSLVLARCSRRNSLWGCFSYSLRMRLHTWQLAQIIL